MEFEKLKTNLKKRGFHVSCFDTKEEAAAYLDSRVDRTTVGFGGSVTLKQMGLFEKLSAHNTVVWHHQRKDGESMREAKRRAAAANVYFSSVNAIAETGEIINIDGEGNRLASVFYGHKKVYLVAGENKITPDYESALYRARNVAAPKNAQRLGVKTPCAAKGDRCYDCSSPERICCGLSVLWRNMMNAYIEIVLIHEDLGY